MLSDIHTGNGRPDLGEADPKLDLPKRKHVSGSFPLNGQIVIDADPGPNAYVVYAPSHGVPVTWSLFTDSAPKPGE